MSDKEILSALNIVAADELGRLKYLFGEAEHKVN